MQDLTTFIIKHPLLSAAIIVILILITIIELIRAKRSTTNLNPAQVTQLINRENAVVIDIRQHDAYRNGHIIDAQSVVPREIQQNLKKLEKFKNRPIIVVSNANNESQKIAALLLKHGYNAYSLAGGIRAWIEAQMPLVKE
ncbi:MAG: rhodanese-like domain-containing protein [Gammaproteobacteria bacterium]|nr:rhodanese-like domain-containing protein [Gammaproteobacteria bacterium]MCW5583298.1 rhodanese-like domain-containing protein [Gammaproteobacteria bacterium]